MNVKDRLVSDARSLQDLIARAELADPVFAAALKGKALIASKSVWGTLATMGLSWAAGRYGLALDADAAAMVSGALVMITTTVMRLITAGPITGIVNAKPPTLETTS
jgi:hypothetical protein